MAQNENGRLRGELARRRSGSECARSSAQAMTALGTARLEDGTTCAGAHTVSEPMLTGSAAVVWLKGALHGGSLYWAPGGNGGQILCAPVGDPHEKQSCQATARKRPSATCQSMLPEILSPAGTEFALSF